MDAIEQARVRKWAGILLIGGAILGTIYLANKKFAKINPLSIVKIETANELNPNRKDIVHLKDGTAIEDIGYGLQPLGSYSDDEVFTALVLLGRNCQDCEDEDKLYVYSTSDSRNNVFELPGKVFAAPKEGETEGDLISHSRIFYGRCLPDSGHVLVSTKEEKFGGDVRYSAAIWGFNSGHAFVELRHEEGAAVNALIESVSQNLGKNCKEVAGVERMIQP